MARVPAQPAVCWCHSAACWTPRGGPCHVLPERAGVAPVGPLASSVRHACGRTPLLAGALQNGTNLLLDVGWVLGLGWGVRGAAGAAAAGQWVGAAALVALLVHPPPLPPRALHWMCRQKASSC